MSCRRARQRRAARRADERALRCRGISPFVAVYSARFMRCMRGLWKSPLDRRRENMGAGVPRAGHNMLPEVREFRPFLLLQGQQPSVSSQALPYSIYQPASERGEASQFLSQTRSEGNKYRSSQPPFACPALRIPPLPPRQQIRHVERAMLSAECLSLSRVSNHNSCHNYGFFTIINLVLTRLLPVSWEGINYT